MNQCDGVVANCLATGKLLLRDYGTQEFLSRGDRAGEAKGSYKEKSAHVHETVAVGTMIPG